jgi:hypothetical protein
VESLLVLASEEDCSDLLERTGISKPANEVFRDVFVTYRIESILPEWGNLLHLSTTEKLNYPPQSIFLCNGIESLFAA